MKPVSTYLSLYPSRNKVRLFLFMCLLAQVFYISLGTLKFSLPSRISEISINSFLPENFEVSIGQPYIRGISRIGCKTLVVRSNEMVVLEFNDLSLPIKPTWPLDNYLSFFSGLNFSKVKVLPDKTEVGNFEILDFSLKNYHMDHPSFLHAIIKSGNVQADLNLEFQNINKIFENILSAPKSSTPNYESFFNSLVSAKNEISLWTTSLPPLSTEFQGVVNSTNGRVFISQNYRNDKADPDIKNFLSELNWQVNLANVPLINFSFQTKAEKLVLNTLGIGLDFSFPFVQGKGTVDLEKFDLRSTHTNFTFQKLTASGKVSGDLHPISLSISKEFNIWRAYLFADTEHSDVSLTVIKDDSEWNVDGFIELIPNHNNFRAQLPQGELKILDGERLYVKAFENLTPITKKSKVQFSLNASKFSVLQTPPGDFYFTGEMLSDLSIFINHAYGKLGRSEVSGSYHQYWHPLNYRFLINGTCHPPDISNWLGVWWPPLWEDFSFGNEIPWGNFSIEGIWAGPAGNSVTIGQVKTKDLIFRNFPLISSQIKVAVNGQSTDLLGEKIKHHFGTLDGSLSFPRTSEKSDTLFSFSLKGDLPINEANEVFGERVQEVLSEFNAASIYCEAKGEIMKDTASGILEGNKSWYELDVSTAEPFSYSGINIDYARGKIFSSEGLIKANFDEFGMASGQGKLNFYETSTQSNQISFSMDLKNAESNELFNNLSKSSPLGNITPSQDSSSLNDQNDENKEIRGKVDLSIFAEGPSSDIKFYEGTGNIHFYDVDIGSIHFLGGIRERLGSFNFPLPSDALYFSNLEAPFALEQDRLIFDQAILSGPVSRIEAKGEVNWVKQEVDLMADFKLAGNLGIPVLKQIINWADPLSKLSKLKIQGNWDNPEWSIHLGTNLLKP